MKRITAIMIFAFTVSFGLSAFLDKPKSKPAIRFKTLTSTIKSDTSGTIEALIWNGERDQLITIDCTVWDGKFSFTGKVYPNNRNVTLYYTGHIKLK